MTNRLRSLRGSAQFVPRPLFGFLPSGETHSRSLRGSNADKFFDMFLEKIFNRSDFSLFSYIIIQCMDVCKGNKK